MAILLPVCGCGNTTSTDFSEAAARADTGAANKQVDLTKWREDKTLKILAIGNSFSDNTMSQCYQIAQKMGIQNIKLGVLYIGACTVYRHWLNATQDAPAYEYRVNTDGTWKTTPDTKMRDAITSDHWDYIILSHGNDSSYKGGSLDASGAPSGIGYQKLGDLIAYVRGFAGSDTIFAWNMTWAYSGDDTTTDYIACGKDTSLLYSKLVEATQKYVLPYREISIILPTGTAIQNIRSSYLQESAMAGDGHHLNPYGSYVAGLTLLKMLTGLSIEHVGYTDSQVLSKESLIAIEAADHAVDTPYKMTVSSFQKEMHVPSGTASCSGFNA